MPPRNAFGDTVVPPKTTFGDTIQPGAATIGPAEDEAFIGVAPPQRPEIVGRNSPESIAGSFGIGANRGLANVAGAPVDLVAAGLRAAGVPATDPIGGSASIANLLQSLGLESTPEGFARLTNREPTQTERVVGRVGEEVGAGAIAALPVGAIARTAAPVAPARTTIGRIGQSIVAPARTAPVATAATDVALSGVSGLGAGAAREIAPGNATAELIGQFSPLLLPAIVASGVRGALRGGASGQDALQASIDDFTRAGTTPSVGQGTGNVAAQGVESTLGRLPGGAGVMVRTGQRQASQIGERVSQISTSMARNADAEQAGRLIASGLSSPDQGFVGRFQDVSERLFNELDGFIPGSTPVPATNSQATLSALSRPVSGAEQLSDALLINPAIRRAEAAFAADLAGSGTIPYETLKNVRSAMGRMLTSGSLVDDIPRAEIRRIYAALSADMQAAAAAAGPDATRAFERANGYYRAGLNRIENVLEPLIRNRTPEKIFTALERSGRDGATTIRTIYRSLTPTERATTTALVLRRLGHATPGRQGAEGLEFSPETFLTNWNRLAPDSKAVLFNQPEFGALRSDLDAIARAAQRIREGTQVLANPSGTGAAQSQAAGLALGGAGVFQAAQGQFGLLGTVLAGMASAQVGSQLMTSPRFVRWLAQTTAMSPASLPTHLGRLTTTLQDADSAMAAEVVELLGVLSNSAPPPPSEGSNP